MIHVMLDIETLAKSPNAAIVSIGAVKFDPADPDRDFQRFYQNISAEDCTRYGLEIDAGTVIWWFRQDDDVRKSLLDAPVDLATALDGFAMWFADGLADQSPSEVPVWGNAPSFDNVIVRNAYEAVGLVCPFTFRQDRCYRTLKNIVSVPMPPKGMHHNALADAEFQANHLISIWGELFK